MPKSRIIITLGIIIAILPLLGFPRLWESFFQVAIGLSIVLVSVWASIDKRLTLKAKAQKRQIHKRRIAEIQSQAEAPQEEIVVQPEQGQNL
jgi:apolipoprotein N-acyltransferase